MKPVHLDFFSHQKMAQKLVKVMDSIQAVCIVSKIKVNSLYQIVENFSLLEIFF